VPTVSSDPAPPLRESSEVGGVSAAESAASPESPIAAVSPVAPAESAAPSPELVIDSVYRTYPMLQATLLNRNIALGQQTEALGAFDTKLKGASENGPVGFYETYRQSVGVVKPTYWGGEVFGGGSGGAGASE